MAQANSGDEVYPEARLAFSDGLWEAVAQGTDGSGDKKYGCTLIWEHPAEALAQLRKNIVTVVKEKWGEKGLTALKEGRIKSPIFTGKDKQAYSSSTGERWNGFTDDCIFIRAKNNANVPPLVLWKSLNVPVQKDEDVVYSGCYGNPVLNAYTWEHPTGGRGVTFNVLMFQKTRDGDRLGGRAPVNAAKFFVEIPDEAGKGDTPFFN